MSRLDAEQIPEPSFGKVVEPLLAFFSLEAASGILLLASAFAALIWVNLFGADSYRAVFEYSVTLGLGERLLRFTVRELLNDGLMTFFFALVGLEMKREFVCGELNTPARAALPAIAALGGMMVPAAIYSAFNWHGAGRSGWGIPIATDIAFSLGLLTMMRSRVPSALVAFVTALAIFDDIGGILVIAFFYGRGFSYAWALLALALALLLVFSGKHDLRSGWAYLALGSLLWLSLKEAGAHPAIAGVIVGLCVPARTTRPARKSIEALARHVCSLEDTPSDEDLDAEALVEIRNRLTELEPPLPRFVSGLHPYVAFALVPAFALANSGLDVHRLGLSDWVGPVTVGTATGLALGKLAGIASFTGLAVKARLAPFPRGASLPKLLGVSTVAGIGFTVSLFIAALAFPGDGSLLAQAKAGILVGSLVAGVMGALVLRLTRSDTPGSPATG